LNGTVTTSSTNIVIDKPIRNTSGLKLDTFQSAGIYINTQDNQTNNRFPILFNGAPLYKMPITTLGFNGNANSDQDILAKNFINGLLITDYNRNSNNHSLKLPLVKNICLLIDQLSGAGTALGYAFNFTWDTTPISSSSPGGARLRVQTGAEGESGIYTYVGRFNNQSTTISDYLQQSEDRVQQYTCRVNDWNSTSQVGEIIIMDIGENTSITAIDN